MNTYVLVAVMVVLVVFYIMRRRSRLNKDE